MSKPSKQPWMSANSCYAAEGLACCCHSRGRLVAAGDGEDLMRKQAFGSPFASTPFRQVQWAHLEDLVSRERLQRRSRHYDHGNRLSDGIKHLKRVAFLARRPVPFRHHLPHAGGDDATRLPAAARREIKSGKIPQIPQESDRPQQCVWIECGPIDACAVRVCAARRHASPAPVELSSPHPLLVSPWRPPATGAWVRLKALVREMCCVFLHGVWCGIMRPPYLWTGCRRSAVCVSLDGRAVSPSGTARRVHGEG